MDFYVNLVREHGQPGAAQSGFTECLNTFSQGNAAMWYDATSAAGLVENGDDSPRCCRRSPRCCRSTSSHATSGCSTAAELDGAGVITVLRRIILPLAAPGLAATSLICFIFSWNELLFARSLTSTAASTAPVFLTGFITSQGLFLAQLCAAAFAVSLPVLIAGFAAQDKLVQGLTLGAVK